MKRVFAALCAGLLLAACESEGYKIEGTFASAEDGTVVYMTAADEFYTTLDSTVISGGRFEFTGEQNERCVRMLLVPAKAVGGPVVVERGVVNVEIGRELKRGGTSGNIILQRFLEAKEHLQALDDVTSPSFLKAMPMDKSVYDSLVVVRDKARASLAEYASLVIETNIENNLGVYVLSRSYALVDAARLVRLLNKVPSSLRDARYNLVCDYVAVRAKSSEQRTVTAVGQQYLNFELPSRADEKVLFSSLVSKHRYTLLQFWASWCASCRVELPEFDKLREEYAVKGFALVGVSLDTDAAAWRGALASLALGGVQLCSPSGGSGEVAAEYGVDAVPANLLINNKGVIVARDVSPSELDSILNENLN